MKVQIGDATLYLGDCMDILPTLGKVDAVITDPPYGTVKGASLKGWEGRTEWDDALDPVLMFEHCSRMLRMNGALILFSQEPYTARLITQAHNDLPFAYRLMWLKDHFANALLAKTAPVSYFEDVVVYFKKYDTEAHHPLRSYALQVLQHCGGSLNAVNATLGHRRAEHFFYVDSTQFGLCTRETYADLCVAYGIDLQPWFQSFDALLAANQKFIRRFNLPVGREHKSNVLQYRKDRDGHHPTQKPIALMSDLIETYTDAGDTVLDFTMGSGSTGVACRHTGRKFIGIEREPKYFDIACKRIEQAVAQGRLFDERPAVQIQESLL